MVGKSELLDLVWPNIAVAEDDLQLHLAALRKLLGSTVISTIPGCGYRFAAVLDHAPSGSGAAIPTETSTATTLAPPRCAPNTNLPEVLPPLIGRDDDLAELDLMLDQHRLVTVIGAGGTGKTRLAQYLVHQRRNSHRHGVFWVELASLSDALLVVSTIASALSIQTGNGDPLNGLVAALKSMSLLLALDNAEHLIDEVARVVQAIIPGAPQVRLLVTSQMPLKHTSEQIYRLGSLALPEVSVPVSEAMTFGAVALFVERARAANRQFELTPKNVETVVGICRSLDGMALAIELAAARVPLLGVSKLAQTLNDRLRLLTGGNRGAPQRQQALRAALEWSHGLLNPVEQAVFRRLSVFAGGFSLEVAQYVVADEASDPPLDGWAILDVLGALVDRSLVMVEGAEPPRYRLLESPRTYALERLVASREEASWRRRHAQALLARFTSVDADCWAGHIGVDDAVQALGIDLDNAREALAWAIEHDPSTAVALAPSMDLALTRDRHEERRRLWETTAEHVNSDLPDPLRVAWTLGYFGFWASRKSELSTTLLAAAVSWCQRREDAAMLYRALVALIRCDCQSQNGGELRALLKELRALENPNWPARLRYHGAVAQYICEYESGDFDAAQASMQRTLALAEQAGDSEGVNVALTDLANSAMAAGRVDDAIRLGVALESRLIASRHQILLAAARLNLAGAWLARNNLAQAREVAQKGWPTAAQFELQPPWGDTLALLAALENRPRCAARLQGYGDAAHSARSATKDINDARAAERVDRLVREHMCDAEFERLKAEGAALDDEDVASVAFGLEDT